MDAKIKKAIIALSLRETSYFERLIEDLLLFSQVSEPNYGGEQDHVVLKDLLEEEVDDQKIRHQNSESGKNLEFIKQIQDSDFVLNGNKVLLQRIFKNIFTNAASFAQNKIIVQLKQNDLTVEVIVEDDGSGFSIEQLQSFGLCRMSRQIIREKNNNERLSIGLGSVVIKKIVELHRGEVSVENVQTTDQSRTGARLTLRFNLK